MAKKMKPINKALAFKVLETVDAGLVNGPGYRTPGQMCVEAAVAYAYGEKHHTDQPRCVNFELAHFKIALNDMSAYDSDKQRAQVLRRVAIAQLGSASPKFSWDRFASDLANMVNQKWYRKALKSNKKLVERMGVDLKRVQSEDMYQDFCEKYDGVDFEPVCLPPNDNIDSSDFCHDVFDRAYQHIHSKNNRYLLAAKWVAEAAVQCLIKQKVPGTKYLYLTERKKSRKTAKRRAKK